MPIVTFQKESSTGGRGSQEAHLEVGKAEQFKRDKGDGKVRDGQ